MLANGVAMPPHGFGTWPISDREVEPMVAAAIETGYRLIDTAEMYGNESGVGRGIKASGVDRDQVFVTTKLSQKWHGYDEAQQAFSNSARLLDLEYLDLFLIHWPNPARDRYVDAWRGMIELLDQGRVRAIGVSNFKPAHLDRLIEATGVAPHVNQIQINPRIPRTSERSYHAAHGIVTESWAPIGKGSDMLQESTIIDIGRDHAKTPAQVVLRWHLQLGLIPIPKTANRSRLKENIHIFDFSLTEEEMEELDGLDRDGQGAVDSDRTSL
jgi:2,5-diketo-D-gluconate reductase A